MKVKKKKKKKTNLSPKEIQLTKIFPKIYLKFDPNVITHN